MMRIRRFPAISAPRLAPAIPPPTITISKSTWAGYEFESPAVEWWRHVQRCVYPAAARRTRRDSRVRGGGGRPHLQHFESAQPHGRAAGASLLAVDCALAVA